MIVSTINQIVRKRMTKSTQYAHCSVDGWYTRPVGLRLTRCLVKKQDLDDEKSLWYRVVQRTRLIGRCQYKQLYQVSTQAN